MENKQTAVEWLYETIIIFPETNNDLAHNARSFKKAKQMEKEQIKDFFNFGIGYDNLIDDCNSIFNDYYNETYGN